MPKIYIIVFFCTAPVLMMGQRKLILNKMSDAYKATELNALYAEKSAPLIMINHYVYTIPKGCLVHRNYGFADDNKTSATDSDLKSLKTEDESKNMDDSSSGRKSDSDLATGNTGSDEALRKKGDDTDLKNRGSDDSNKSLDDATDTRSDDSDQSSKSSDGDSAQKSDGAASDDKSSGADSANKNSNSAKATRTFNSYLLKIGCEKIKNNFDQPKLLDIPIKAKVYFYNGEEIVEINL